MSSDVRVRIDVTTQHGPSKTHNTTRQDINCHLIVVGSQRNVQLGSLATQTVKKQVH